MALWLADLLIGLGEAAVGWAGDDIGDADQQGTNVGSRDLHHKGD